MNINIPKRLKQIETENFIWIIYLFIIGFSFYANSLEKDYFLTQNRISKNKYKEINIMIFSILIIIYSYFERDAIESFCQKEKTKKKASFDTLILIASSAVLLSGFIFLYILLKDDNLEEEIAFN